MLFSVFTLEKWQMEVYYKRSVCTFKKRKRKEKHLICWSVPLTGTSIQQRSAHSGKSHSCEALQQIVNSDETAEDDLRAKNEFQIFGQTFSNLSLTF